MVPCTGIAEEDILAAFVLQGEGGTMAEEVYEAETEAEEFWMVRLLPYLRGVVNLYKEHFDVYPQEIRLRPDAFWAYYKLISPAIFGQVDPKKMKFKNIPVNASAIQNEAIRILDRPWREDLDR